MQRKIRGATAAEGGIVLPDSQMSVAQAEDGSPMYIIRHRVDDRAIAIVTVTATEDVARASGIRVDLGDSEIKSVGFIIGLDLVVRREKTVEKPTEPVKERKKPGPKPKVKK